MPPNEKNKTTAKIAKGDASASSIRPAIRKPSKPATPNTVTASSAVEAVHILDLLPIPVPIRSTKGWSRQHRKTSRRGQPKYKRVIKPEGAFQGGSRRAAPLRLIRRFRRLRPPQGVARYWNSSRRKSRRRRPARTTLP